MGVLFSFNQALAVGSSFHPLAGQGSSLACALGPGVVVFVCLSEGFEKREGGGTDPRKAVAVAVTRERAEGVQQPVHTHECVRASQRGSTQASKDPLTGERSERASGVRGAGSSSVRPLREVRACVRAEHSIVGAAIP